MTWKEEFNKQFPAPSLPVIKLEDAPKVKIQQDALDEYYRLANPAIKRFISTEIIEKLIEDIPNHRGRKTTIDLNDLKQQLRDKWSN